ncbi:hypothetical protein OH77DRAFT_1136710 [Trametes cingulata]|nr:hypothetical protein OH77DRAFT_1136710 [Trametes cingulata]
MPPTRQVPFHAVLAEQFSATFDVYLDILHQVDLRVAQALSRDSKDWRMLNACLPCLYRLDDDPPLRYDLLAAMDGNSSLKLVDETYRSGTTRLDGRTGRTDLFIPVQEVDRFKDEVQNARKKSTAKQPDAASPPIPLGARIINTAPAAAENMMPGTAASAPTLSTSSAPSTAPPPSTAPSLLPSAPVSVASSAAAPAPAYLHVSSSLLPSPPSSSHNVACPLPTTTPPVTDAAGLRSPELASASGLDECPPAAEPMDSPSLCAERWRNAGPEARKKMFALFSTTGIFSCLCRHGQVLAVCDMIRSGELLKYPIAVVDKLLAVYDKDLTIKLGYDIYCEFDKTLKRSSLGPRAEGRVSGVVPAFHGHSHNRPCQLLWHPMYMAGVGKEDFEGCERFFSQLNGLASGTRLATQFHRHQAIEQYVQFWGMQKHEESGKFIFNNYRQALQIIDEGVRALDVYALELGTSDADYERYLVEERDYLQSLQSEPPELAQKMEYMEALDNLEKARLKDKAAVELFKKLDFLIVTESLTPPDVRKVRRDYRSAQVRVQQAEEEVRRLEELLEIEERWLPHSPEYKAMQDELACRKYRRALDKLERLVVQRLFELDKLGMSGVAYKMRDKIGKALKTRAEAIRKALTEYNRRAAELRPPRPQLVFSEIMDMVSLGEFDLLRDARRDVRKLEWAKRANREAMGTYFNVKRAREEVARLNVELRRLFSAMLDEHVDYHRAISAVSDSSPALARELERRQRRANAVNAKVVTWLCKASRLPGFSGTLSYGHRVGRDRALVEGVPLPVWASRVDVHAGDDGDDGNDGDDGQGGGIPGLDNIREAGPFLEALERLGGDADST